MLDETLLAGGNDNWMYQLRDRYGKWVFMGGLGRFFGRDSSGKIRSAIGEIVGIPNDRSAIMRVSSPSEGVKEGTYLVPAKNISRAVAVLDESTLRKRGVRIPTIPEQSGIPNFDRMEAAAAEVSANRELPVNMSLGLYVTGREGTSQRDTPLPPFRDWKSVDNNTYVSGQIKKVIDAIAERMIAASTSSESLNAAIGKYKTKYGSDWISKFKADIREAHEDLAKDVYDRYSKVDIYQRGTVTVVLDRDFRDLPESVDEMFAIIEKLNDRTRDNGRPVELVISGDDSTLDSAPLGQAGTLLTIFSPANDNRPTGNINTEASILINAAFLKPEHREKFYKELIDANNKILEAGDQAPHFNPAALEGTIEDFVQYVIAHEWGHHLDYAFNRTEDGRTRKNIVKFEGEEHEAYGLSTILAQLLEEYPWLLNYLSGYSAEKPAEALAELFAQVFMEDVMGANVSGIPDSLKNLIRRLVMSAPNNPKA